MKFEPFTLLVISDPHAHSANPTDSASPSYFSTNALYASARLNPIADISALIRRTGLPVQWILAPGDLGDKADPSSQRHAWMELERIRTEVGARSLIGTTGNHDIDSKRQFPDFDPKSALQALSPPFPISRDCYEAGDQVYIDRFWSRNYVVIPDDDHDCTLVILNSSAFHGYSSDSKRPPNEHLRGKISPLTLDAITNAVASRTSRLNILLLHHHVKTHPWIQDGNSVMVGGDRLLEMLKSTGKQWLIVHGHQHVPHLSYADGDSLAPVVLSAGSVAAKTYPVRGRHPRNQIHLISLFPDRMDPSGAELLGTVMSWSWTAEVGWREAASDGGLPHMCGFGYRPTSLELRDSIINNIRSATDQQLSWSQLGSSIPKLPYLIPDHLDNIVRLLQSSGVEVQFGPHGEPSLLELRNAR